MCEEVSSFSFGGSNFKTLESREELGNWEREEFRERERERESSYISCFCMEEKGYGDGKKGKGEVGTCHMGFNDVKWMGIYESVLPIPIPKD